MPDASPYASLSRHADPRTSDKRALLALSRSIEARALTAAPHADLWVSLQHVRFHTGRTRRLHEDLARAGVRVHVYGVRVRDGRPAPSTMTFHDISEFGLLAQEWDVLLVTPDIALGLTARILPSSPVSTPTASVPGSALDSAETSSVSKSVKTLGNKARKSIQPPFHRAA